MLRAALIACLLIIGLPCLAMAWGPGAHLAVGSTVLLNLGLVAPGVARILRRHIADFLYGIVAADVTLAKGLARSIHNCHNWEVAKRMHGQARSDASHAFCYGYQAHLASDVIAHNYYIPNKLIISFRHPSMGHTYWETRFESRINPEVWKSLKDLARRSFEEHDELMERMLRPTIFSFRTNKRIFSSMMLVARLKKWQQIVARSGKRSRVTLDQDIVKHYLDLSIEAALEFLADPDSAPILSYDPTGKEAIRAARAIRKNLRWMDNRGLMHLNILDDVAEEFTPPVIGPLMKGIRTGALLTA